MLPELRNEEVREVLKEGKLHLVAPRYLNLYVGHADWVKELNILKNKIYKKSLKEEISFQEALREVVSCAILLPAADRSIQIDKDHPENHLHRIPYFQQLSQKNWFELFRKTFQQDVNIDTWRAQALGLGIVTHLDLAPITRQALNWLCTKANENNDMRPDTVERFKNLVSTYGGTVICNIFSKHQPTLKKVLNWKTGYFFERNIFNVYQPEQVFKIKRAELEKTNPKLVKQFSLSFYA